MGLAAVGVLVNLLVSMGASVETVERGVEELVPVIWSFFGISVLGLILAAANMRKAGGIMVIIGSAFFVPIGLIGVFGGKKIMSGTDDIEARRKLAEGAGNE